LFIYNKYLSDKLCSSSQCTQISLKFAVCVENISTPPERKQCHFGWSTPLLLLLLLLLKKTNLTCRERASRTGYKVETVQENTEGNVAIGYMIG